MIFGFSVLVSVYATAIVAGLAYQQIEPIVKIVPLIATFVVKLKEGLEQRWKRFTSPEIQRRMEKVRNFLDNNQELAEWVLRKLVVRLALGWGALALSIVFICLLIGTLLQTEAEARVIQLSKDISVNGWISVILPSLGILGALVVLSKNRIKFHIESDDTKVAQEQVSQGFLARQLMKMEETGRGMLNDLASVSQMGRSLSALSHSERTFIQRYIDAIAWLRRMEALLASVEWQRLELESETPDKLMDAAEEFWQDNKFSSAFFYYVEVLNLLADDRPSKRSEAFVRVRLGGCYANNGDERAAIQEFEKAAKQDKEEVKAVCSEHFKRVIEPIKDKPSFQEFCRKLQKEEKREAQRNDT